MAPESYDWIATELISRSFARGARAPHVPAGGGYWMTRRVVFISAFQSFSGVSASSSLSRFSSFWKTCARPESSFR